MQENPDEEARRWLARAAQRRRNAGNAGKAAGRAPLRALGEMRYGLADGAEEHLEEEREAILDSLECREPGWRQALAEGRVTLRQGSAVFQALGRNASKRKGARVLELAQRTFRAVELPESEEEMQEELPELVRAALRLCAKAKGGQRLAELIWDWAQGQEILDPEAAKVMLGFWEAQGRSDAVDRLLRQMNQRRVEMDESVLSTLLSAAAERSDWQRTDELWNLLVRGFRVPVSPRAYLARARAHFEKGRVEAALRVLDEADEDAEVALEQLQLLVILCHSSPSLSNRRRLERHLSGGGSGGKGVQKAWQSLEHLAEALLDETRSSGGVPQLRQLLVTPCAKRSSVRTWPEFAAASEYLRGYR
ncbi:unnamed protein product [Effrenium voratum]|nr:unnamed protein product [Effrenium voratum]